MNPSIGRIVHFVYGGVHFAAIVVKVCTSTCVNLFVFPNGSDYLGLMQIAGSPVGLVTSIMWADDNSEMTWHWPEREDA